MNWTKLRGSKHDGKTLPQVMFSDPDFFFWGYEKGTLGSLWIPEREVEDIFKKACSIKIPECRVEDPVVEYVIHPHSGDFSSMEIVPRERPRHMGTSQTERTDAFDMSIPRKFKHNDKPGNKAFLRDLKYYLFGDKAYRMNKKRCEEFFDNPENFALKQQKS